jgi:hypothetical protein
VFFGQLFLSDWKQAAGSTRIPSIFLLLYPRKGGASFYYFLYRKSRGKFLVGLVWVGYPS